MIKHTARNSLFFKLTWTCDKCGTIKFDEYDRFNPISAFHHGDYDLDFCPKCHVKEIQIWMGTTDITFAQWAVKKYNKVSKYD
jgi:hypothetical protein